MNIVELNIENVKRIKAIHIKPGGKTVVIGGRNGQGKSSVLDAIMYAIGGTKTIAGEPVRRGEKGAVVRVNVGKFIIERKWNEAGNSTLKVMNAEGASYASPQSILDGLVGELTFDPLTFMRIPAKQQAATLRELLGLDFKEVDRRRAEIFAERTDVNRDRDKAKSVFESMPYYENAPESPVSIDGLLDELKAANKAATAKRLAKDRVDQLNERIDHIHAEIARLKKLLDQTEEYLASSTNELTAAIQKADAMPDSDSDKIEQDIRSARVVNDQVKANASRFARAEKVDLLEKRSLKLTEAIEAIDAEKAKTLADAKFPIDGLSFGEAGVIFNGLPMDQASSAEQLRVSVAMGLALNPKLRVMLIRDGSLLDPDSLKALTEQAEKADAQVWIERVSVGEEVSVIIEDGAIVEPAKDGAK